MRILSVKDNVGSFKSRNLHLFDMEYKKALQRGLKDTFQIKCKVEDLESIAGPIELKEIIRNLKPFQYAVGENFRANFHLHTKASDGNLTPVEFLSQCRDWANHIFQSHKKDRLPPFSAAITDHNRINSVKEAIALIGQSPEEYKNVRFVTGCEFLFTGYRQPYSAFEVVGLGFNPFDEEIQTMTQGSSSKNDVKDIKKVKNAGGILSWAHPIVTPDKINEDFFTFLKNNGIDGVEGNYQYSRWDNNYVNSIKPLLESLIEKFNMFVTGGTDSHRKTIF